jgi:predicted nucleotidyltransferase
MIAKIDNYLKKWFDNSKLEGFYIIGSYSLKEQNEKSDIDFLGVSEKTLNQKKIQEIQNSLKKNLKHIDKNKIGIRIRTIDELNSFQTKLKSWGYDLNYATKIFGNDIAQYIGSWKSIPIDKRIIFDNLLEKKWFDLLYINLKDNQQNLNYLCSKSILDLLNFILYFNGIALSHSINRIKYLKKNINLIDSFSISIDDFEKALNIKRNPLICYTGLDLYRIKNILLDDIYMKYFSEFKEIENSFTASDYWGYDNRYFKPIRSITSSTISSNKYFLWRSILMDIFKELDDIKLQNDKQYIFSEAKLIIQSIFLKEQELSIDNKDKTLHFLLKELEKIRIKISKNGKDISKYY